MITVTLVMTSVVLASMVATLAFWHSTKVARQQIEHEQLQETYRRSLVHIEEVEKALEEQLQENEMIRGENDRQRTTERRSGWDPGNPLSSTPRQ